MFLPSSFREGIVITASGSREQGTIQRIILAIVRQIFSIVVALSVLAMLLFALNQQHLSDQLQLGVSYVVYICVGLIVSIVGVIVFELIEIAHIRAQRARWAHFRKQLHTLAEKSPELLVLFELTQDMQKASERRSTRQSMLQNFIFFALGVATPVLLQQINPR